MTMQPPFYQDENLTLHHGRALDVVRTMPDASVDCIVTSPPYFGLRDYGADGQIGSEQTLTEYIDSVVALFRESRRVLASHGTLWLNLGDSYARGFGGGSPGKKSSTNTGSFTGRKAGKKAIPGSGKNLIGVPWRVALAMQDDGWTLRSDIIWSKPNAMPESVKDRPSKAHEYLFMFTKTDRYHYDQEAVRKPNGSNSRTVWEIPNEPFKEAHFATFPPELPRRCILAGSKPGDTVLDPFSGSATTGMVALQLDRNYIGIDIKAAYLQLSLDTRLQNAVFNIT